MNGDVVRALDKDLFLGKRRWSRFKAKLPYERPGPAILYPEYLAGWILRGFANWLERWHLLRIAAALLVLFGIPAFAIDLVDRTEERTVHAWQLLTTPAPGNSGKREALEYLNGQPWYWPVRQRSSLTGVDLSEARHGGGVHLARTKLRSANLKGSNFDGADLSGSDLAGSDFFGASFRNASLNGANLRGADLRKADLRGADLSQSNLTDALLHSANIGNTVFVNVTGLLIWNMVGACFEPESKPIGLDPEIFRIVQFPPPPCPEVPTGMATRG